MSTLPNTIAPAEALRLQQLVTPVPNGIASRVLSKGAAGTVTIFAFDAGQELSEHQSTLDALVLVLEGSLELTIAGTVVRAVPATIVRVPANVPHAVVAREASRMLLILLR
jgi:quercetin dioxygenase-like cupin family protein